MHLFSVEQIDKYTRKGVWRNYTILDYIFWHAAENPDEEALVDPLNREDLVCGGPKRITYRELLNIVDRVAAGFLDAGISKDDIIAIQLPNIIELIISYLSAARIGAIVTPLGVMYRKHEVEHVLKLCDPVAYIGAASFKDFDNIEMIKELQPLYPNLKTIISVGNEEGRREGVLYFEDLLSMTDEEQYSTEYLDSMKPDANEVFSICWTSGTESEPKGVPRTHNNWIVTGVLNTAICQLPPGCNILATFPMINMAGIGTGFMTWVINGGKLVNHHPFDAATYLKQIPSEKIYYTMVPPALLTMLDNLPKWSEIDKTSLEVLATGGAPLQYWMVKRYREAYNIDIVNEFASNEGTGILTSSLFLSDPEDRAVYFPRYGVDEIKWEKLESIPDEFTRKVLYSSKTKIVDLETREPVTETGVAGELLYKGPGIFPGYWKRPDLTAKVFDREGYYCSGDLFSIQGEKRDKYLFEGRVKDLIIRGGQNISPAEIENLVADYPKVMEVAAVGYPDERLGEKLCVIVVPQQGESITLDEIKNFFEKKGVAIYKYPERLEILDSLPRNAIGKVERKALRKMLQEKT